LIVLDTNIVSESFRPRPNPSVVAWLNTQPKSSLYLCTPVLAELRFGIEKLPSGPRQNDLRLRIDRLEHVLFQDRILLLDPSAASEFGRLTAARERMGRRIEPMDGLIAAIALSNRMTLATRDVSDFADIGLDLINPFEASPST
jgi:toxin FitB